MTQAHLASVSSWNTPEHLHSLRAAGLDEGAPSSTVASPSQRDRAERAQRWRELCRLSDDGDVAAVAAIDAALSTWSDLERRAPLSSFANVVEREATGPHDPGDTVVVGVRDVLGWPIAISRHLDLHATGITEAHLQALAGRPELGHITSVDVNVGKSPRVVQGLLGTLPLLRSISLHGMFAEASSLTSLLPALPETLSTLSLSWFLEGAAGPLVDVFAARHQAGHRLQVLRLEKCRLGPALADVINTGALSSLRSLTLHGTSLNDEAAQAWARAWQPGQRAALEHLDLQDDPFDGGFEVGDGFIDLVDAGVFDSLSHLRVGYHNLCRERLQHLLMRADLSQLHTLQLWAVSFTDDDARAIIGAAARLPALRTIEVETDALSAELKAALKAISNR